MVISATTFTSHNNNNNLRDASFSSYLNNKEVKDPFADSIHPFISNKKEPFHLGVKKEEDGEIGVFDAEKYFNEVDIETPKVAPIDANKFKYLQDQQQNRSKYKVQYGTPSVGSESSLNSQSALLQIALKNSSNSRKNQVHRKSLLATLGCKCSCYDKNSVDVSDHAGEISFNKGVVHGKSTSEKLFKHDHDASNHSVKNKKTDQSRAAAELLMNKDIYIQKQEKISTYKMQHQQVENPRKRLEVFGSPILDERCKSLSFDMRLKIPSWEAATKLEEQEIVFSTNCDDENNYDDDDEIGSDASSDLFEIESFTGNKTNSFLSRTTSHVASGCTSPNFYAPSEASIEWSVVTASAVEYSAVSDHEDQGSVVTVRRPIRTSLNSSNGKTRINKEMPRRRHGKLLGCNSQKSVGVAADAFTTTNEKQSTNPKMLPQMTRFKVESFGAKNEHGYAKPPLRRSHSPHGAQLLYI